MQCKSAYHLKKFRAIAGHEAGHAVFCVLFGFRFSEVRIYPEIHPVPPGGATLGEVLFDRKWPAYASPWNPRFDAAKAYSYCTQDACMTLAGPLAESRYIGKLPVGLLSGTAEKGTDAAFIRELAGILGLTDSAISSWTARLSFITLELLHDSAIWDAVTTVADELFRRKTLTGREVACIVERCKQADCSASSERYIRGLKAC